MICKSIKMIVADRAAAIALTVAIAGMAGFALLVIWHQK
jgi:hypothetical protein